MQNQTLPREGQSGLSRQSTNYNCVDLFKFLCAILVCVIHIVPFRGDFPRADSLNFWLQKCLCRVAVPFYFAASGFFLFRNMTFDNLNMAKIKQTCFKLLRLTGLWLALLCVGETLHLWYMGATVVAIAVLTVCLRKNMKLRTLMIMAGILYCIGLIGDAYAGVVAPLAKLPVLRSIKVSYSFLFETTRNGLFMGVPFVLLGALAARKPCKLSLKVAWIGLIISTVLLVGEVYLLSHFSAPADYNMYLMLLPIAFFMLHIALNTKLPDHKIFPVLRAMGTVIYFSHLCVLIIVGTGIIHMRKHLGIDLSSYLFWLTLACTIVLAFVVERLSHKQTFRWLRYLYS